MPVLNLKSVDLHYLWMGEPYRSEGPPPVLLIHGLATNLAFWIPLTSFLEVQNPLLLVDLRGHGRSSMPANGYSVASLAKDLECLMDALAVPTAHFLGHSYGGSVAVEFAGTFPDRCLSLMLADARIRRFQPVQRPQDWPHWAQLRERLESIGVTVRDDQEEAGYHILTELARLSLNLEGMPDWPRRISEVMGGGFSRQTAIRWLDLISRTSISSDVLLPENISPEVLRDLAFPVLSVYGEWSPVLKTADGIAATWPHGCHHRIANAGHFFPLTQARLLSTHVHAFMKGMG